MIKDLKKLSMVDILPDNLLADEQLYAAAAALDKELQLVTEDCKQAMHLSRLDELPEAVVDLLAWQWHVDFYDRGLSLVKKRALVKGSIAWHRKKGTKWAVEHIVRTVFNTGNVREWFEYGGEPYYFRVDVIEPDMLDPDEINRVIKAINSVKNVRSCLDGIGIRRQVLVRRSRGMIATMGKSYVIGPPQTKNTTIGNGVYYGIAVQVYKEVQVNE